MLKRKGRMGPACCPLHALMLGYAGTIRCEEVPSGEAPSFSDGTPKQVTEHCRATLREGRDLVEPADAQHLTIIRGVTVIPMIGPARLANHDVSIRGDRIEAVAPSGALAQASDARIIDGAGKFLAPGLSDMHAHPAVMRWLETMVERFPGLTETERFVLPAGLLMLQQLAAGVTRIDVMAGDPDMLLIRDEVRAGSMPGPVMRVGSPIVDGPIPIQSPKMSWLCGDAKGGSRAAALIDELGYDFAKPYNNLPADTYAALLDGCEARSIDVLGHIPLEVGVEAAIDAGRQSIAHAAELFHWLEGCERTDQARIERLARRLAETKQWVQLTATVTGRYERVLGRGETEGAFPDSRFCNPLIKRVWDPTTPAMKAIRELPQVKILIPEAERLAFSASALLREAGVRLVTGTDAPNPFLADGFSVHEELELLVTRAGFSPYEALRIATVNAAEQHGEGGKSGVVAAGAFADLILLDADPLADIRATRTLSAVWARGAHLSQTGIEQARERILTAFEAMPVPS